MRTYPASRGAEIHPAGQLPVPQCVIADLVAQFGEHRAVLDTGQRVLNDAAVRELPLGVVRRGYAAPE